MGSLFELSAEAKTISVRRNSETLFYVRLGLLRSAEAAPVAFENCFDTIGSA